MVTGRLAFSIAAVVIGVSSASAVPAKKPNVLFIAVDDLKPVLGCYGDTKVKSPNFDRLAARARLFRRAYCNQAVCAPSRNALLTGLRPQTLGIYDLGTNFRSALPDAVTLPQLFRQAGYRTEAAGKIFHVGHGNHEDAASWSVPHWQAKTVAYALPESRAKGVTREEALFSNSDTPVQKLPRGPAFESAEVDDEQYPDGVLATEAVRRLRAAKTERPDEPWFLAVGFLKPHLPFCAPKKYWDLYHPAMFTLPTVRTAPEGAPAFAPTNWGELRQYSDIPATGPLSDAQARRLVHGYYAAISYVDAQLGRLMDAVDELGLGEETIIVVWGDHGWHLGDHGQWCKHTNYEEATRIPLMVAGPGIAPGASSALVESVDLYPTLCELAGLPVPARLDGKSFAALLRNAETQTKEAIFHVYPRGEMIGRAVRTARYRMVEWKKPGTPADTAVLELYDYERDPFETRNHAAEQTETVAQLRALLGGQPEALPQRKGERALNKTVSDRGAMFARRDKNRDGRLTRDEFLDKQPDPAVAPQRFEKFDRDKDGVLTREEFVTMGAGAPR